MEPYATAAQPGPLNGNRPAVGGGGVTDFFYRLLGFSSSDLHRHYLECWFFDEEVPQKEEVST